MRPERNSNRRATAASAAPASKEPSWVDCGCSKLMKQECNMVDGVFCAFKERVMVAGAGVVRGGAAAAATWELGWKPVAKHY